MVTTMPPSTSRSAGTGADVAPCRRSLLMGGSLIAHRPRRSTGGNGSHPCYSPPMTYKGGCHCGRIAFEVDGELDKVVQCNCSICPTCGCAPFAFGSDKTGAARAVVNVRCLDGVELGSLEMMPFDGRSL